MKLLTNIILISISILHLTGISFAQGLEEDYSEYLYWLDKGDEMSNEHQYDVALDCYKKHLEAYPNDTYAMTGCANALQCQGNNSEALRYCQSAIEVDPSYSRAYTIMAATYRNLKEWDKSIQYSKKAIALDPSDGFAYGLMGDVYRNQKLYSKAIEMAKKRIAIDESNNSVHVSSYSVLGAIYEDIDDPMSASICYQNALKVDSRYLPTIYRLEAIYYEDEKYDSSLALLKRIITENLEESYADVYQQVARSSEGAGYYIQAVKYAMMALQAEPDDEYTRYTAVRALRYNGEYAKAIDVAKQTKDPDNSSLAYIYFCMGNREQASKYASKYIAELKKRAKKGEDVDGTMGWASIMKMDMEAGLHWTQKALEKEQQSYAELNLGLAYLCMGQKEKSKETYNRALKSALKRELRAGIHDIECAMNLFDIAIVGNEIISILEEEISSRR